MNRVIEIPKALAAKGDLVIIPRKEYEEYLQLRKVIPIIKMTATEKKEWQRAKQDYKEGKYISLQELQHELGLAPKRKS